MSLRAGSLVMDMMAEAFSDWDLTEGRPKSLSLEEAVRMTLMRLRRNVTFAELGEDFGMAASTAWGYFQEITNMLDELPAVDFGELAKSMKGKICLIDGTLVQVFNWRHRKDLLSGKHRKHGMNVQVIADLHGRVLGVSRGFPGSRHDMYCFAEADLATLADAADTAVGDSGYQGSNMTTPNKKQPGQERSESDRKYNTALATIRVAVEWANAHLKNWRILASRYRDSLSRFDRTVAAIAGLAMINEQYSERKLAFARLDKLRVSE
jgi:DDE superfamily endonuclease/Helix-turn-helix of DDE superfamily endonuclease